MDDCGVVLQLPEWSLCRVVARNLCPAGTPSPGMGVLPEDAHCLSSVFSVVREKLMVER
jgi:hypothetical protein